MKKLSDVWDELPDLEHTRKYVDEKSGLMIYEVCNRKFQETAKLDYVLDILKTIEEKYGERARLAKEQNFSNHSHFIREFKSLTEATPESFLNINKEFTQYQGLCNLRQLKQ